MKTAFLAAAGVLTGFSAAASAGGAIGYVGLALGTQADVNAAFDNFSPPDGRSLRLLGGVRFPTLASFGVFSAEAALNGFGVVGGGVSRTVYQLSAAVKFNLPLGNNFDALGRLGIERNWLNLDDDRYNLSGNGFLVGAGFEYHLEGVLPNASLFVDYTIHHATLVDNRTGHVDETAGMWGLGFTYGF